QIFGLDEQNLKVYNILSEKIGVLAKKLDNYHPKYIGLRKIVKRLEKDLRTQKIKLDDLDKCVDRKTMVDLIYKIVPLLINKKGRSSFYSSETFEESNSAETFVVKE
ncbi:8412_t:CDS:1, partial [Gigaspora margarita]